MYRKFWKILKETLKDGYPSGKEKDTKKRERKEPEKPKD